MVIRWRTGPWRRVPLALWVVALPLYFLGHVLVPGNARVADAFPWAYLLSLQTIELAWWAQDRRRRQQQNSAG
jgi:hypothetical protein